MSFRRIKNLGLVMAIGIVGGLARTTAFGSEDDSARGLLLKVVENQYRGHYHATLELVNEIFPHGRDSLVGQAEFTDEIGERRISLSGPKQAFEYHSLHFGREQWVTDDHSHRIRRIANRQWKKGMFGTLLSYEDILKLPNDFLLEYSSCKSLKSTDSTYQINMMVKPFYQSFYSRLEVTLSKNPVLLTSMVFYGQQAQKLKTMDVKAYQKVAGKWLISELTVSGSDSLSSLSMNFRHFSFDSTPLVQNDKIKAASANLLSKLLPKGTMGRNESGIVNSNDEMIEDVSN